MNYNCTIDIGNSLLKLAFFKANDLILYEKFDYKNNTDAFFEFYTNNASNIQQTIVASVVNIDKKLKTFLTNNNCHFFSPQNDIKIEHRYKTFDTLGQDRLLNVFAAQHLYPQKNTLIISLGSCITTDLIDEKAIYQGGSISPGLNMRFEAVHQFTSKLPLVKPDKNFKNIIGKSTEESIKSGIQNGLLFEIQGFINYYQKNYENLTIILTGGDLDSFVNQLKSNIFAEPFLIHKALNMILNKQ